MTRVSLLLIFALTISLSISFSESFAQQLIVETNKESFESGEIVMVSGSISNGESGDLIALEIKNSKGDTILLRTVELDSSGKYDLTFKIPSSEESGQFEILASAEIKGEKISETKTITQNEISESPQDNNEFGGGCLIATATYGSELSPQVQQLRELRDNKLLQSQSGSSFISGFNNLYYSFSPQIADFERENPYFKESVKLALTPMISSLSILNHVDMNTEAEVLGYGVSLILLNVGMYLGVPAAVIFGIKKRI